MYRALTHFAIEQKIDLSNADQVIKLLKDFNYEIKDNFIYLNGKKMTDELYQNQIVKAINNITPIPGVRDFMVKRQRAMVIQFIVIDTGGITLSEDQPFSKEIKFQAEVAIEEADVIVFVLDHNHGITQEDKMVAKILYKTKKPIILVVNKYDKKTNNEETFNYMSIGLGMPIMISAVHGIGVGDLLDEIINKMNKVEIELKMTTLVLQLLNKEQEILKKEEEVRAYFKYLQYAKILFISAHDKQESLKIIDTVEEVKNALNRKIQTSVFNEILNRAQLLNPAPNHNGGRLKIYYGSQVEAYLPTFVLFVNDPSYVHFS
ncbi:hypothetical protein FQA39_LY12858 [Lamprigera yunnana]|nr:hypothetical protein FQA39_LY12858 [Lamprigera yunnana]